MTKIGVHIPHGVTSPMGAATERALEKQSEPFLIPLAPNSRPLPNLHSPLRLEAPRSDAKRGTDLILTPEQLNGDFEKKLVATLPGKLALLPYRDLDPSREPVILVHGFSSSPQVLGELADKLHDEGKQVFFALYDDKGTRIAKLGQRLATELVRLRKNVYDEDVPLQLVAHSMGGLVCRAALNDLQDPAWLARKSNASAQPRGGFGSVRFHAVDTPWDGVNNVPGALRYVPTLVPGLRAIGWAAIADLLGGSSHFFRSLFTPQLEDVTIVAHNARQTGKKDCVRSFEDLDTGALRTLLHSLIHDEPIHNKRLASYAAGLKQDERFPTLRALLAEVDLETCERDALIALLDHVMPRQLGTHSSLLGDDPTTTDDAFDRIVRDITGSADEAESGH